MPDGGEITTVLRDVSFTHTNGTAEDDLVEHLSLKEIINHHFDFSNLSAINETTIRTFEKVDGITYRLLQQRIYPTDYPGGPNSVIITLNGGGKDMKITLQSAIAEGSNKTIPGNTRDTIRV